MIFRPTSDYTQLVQVNEMKEPKSWDYNHVNKNDADFYFGEDYNKWEQQERSLLRYPIASPGDEYWRSKETFELNKDFMLDNTYYMGDVQKIAHPVAIQPVVKKEEGWKYDYKFLQLLTDEIREKQEFGEGLSMEQVEAVLLGIGYSQPLPSATEAKGAEGEVFSRGEVERFANWILNDAHVTGGADNMWWDALNHRWLRTSQLLDTFINDLKNKKV